MRATGRIDDDVSKRGSSIATDRQRYEAYRAKHLALAGRQGLDAAFAEHNLDALWLALNRGANAAARLAQRDRTVPAATH